MKLILTLVLAVLLFPVCFSAQAQSTMPPVVPGDYPAHVGPFDNASDFDRLPRSRPRAKSAYREDRLVTKGLLAPSADDRGSLRQFLRTPNTGLIRLLPRENTYSESVRKDIAVRGGGAYYSFAMLTHEYGYGSDIELQRDNLMVGFAGADYGMMRRIGNASLDAITVDDAQVAYLRSYSPPGPEPEARLEGSRFRQGVTVDGAFYRAMLPVEVSGTYLLRSIVYDRTDILVALRVIRKDSDGSVTIAWKMLRRYPAPSLIRSTTGKTR